jgi:hypothetical protein
MPATPTSVPEISAASRINGATAVPGPGSTGERLTRDEAFDLLRRAVASLVNNDHSVRASAVRERARELLGRDSESLSERHFIRILKDAHDADVIDLRRRGDDFEVARAEAAPVSDQLARTEPLTTPRSTEAHPTPSRLSLRGRLSSPRGRLSGELPPELLSLGVVDTGTSARSVDGVEPEPEAPAEAAAAPRRGARKRTRASGRTSAEVAAEGSEGGRAAKRPRRSRGKSAAKRESKAKSDES